VLSCTSGPSPHWISRIIYGSRQLVHVGFYEEGSLLAL